MTPERCPKVVARHGTVWDLPSGKVAEMTVLVAVAGYVVEHHVADLLVKHVSGGEENSARLIWTGLMRVI